MGSYVNKILMNDEHVVYEARLHWIIYFSLKSILTLFILPLILVYTSEYVITNKRAIFKIGLIFRKTLEMNLKKIETVNVDQTIMGRILGYGTITIIGTGGTRETFHNIYNPLEFSKKFHEQE
jgi:uncharacterized membrane protein YdbT with pleckstrin-like domain